MTRSTAATARRAAQAALFCSMLTERHIVIEDFDDLVSEISTVLPLLRKIDEGEPL